MRRDRSGEELLLLSRSEPDARSGETLVTLDGVRRSLTPILTVIADGEAVVGVAGVMGGRDSEVSAGTTIVLLECAWFDPKATRSARRMLGLATEASQRFERGADLWGVPDALPDQPRNR